MPLWNSQTELTDEQKARLAEIDAAMKDLWHEGEQYEEYDHTSHGWVWLYRQMPGQAAAQ